MERRGEDAGEPPARIAARLQPSSALAWLEARPGAALAMVVTRARGCTVRVAPAPDAAARLADAIARAEAAGATRALAWHAEGDVPEGGAIAIVGAVAPHRRDAQRAVDVLLSGLKGVATRTDLESPGI